MRHAAVKEEFLVERTLVRKKSLKSSAKKEVKSLIIMKSKL